MAPKKKEQQKMSLGDFLNDSGFGGGSWADEVEESYTAGTQALPPTDKARAGTGYSSWQDRGYSVRESVPSKFPDKPPYTAHLGNLSYEATMETVADFFQDCDVVSVRIIEDQQLQRPKGFGYVEFTGVEGLKKALTLDGQSFQRRMIKIKVADPPRGGDGRGESARDLSDWTRKGPLPDIPGRGGRQMSDFGEHRSRDSAAEGRSAREFTWERRGPLSPLPSQEFGPGSRDGSRPRPAPEGLGERSDSHRGSNRHGPATWGDGRQEGVRSLRRDQPERPERALTAADKDMQWRERMRPDVVPLKSASPPRDSSETPSSPAVLPAAPAVRPRLNLQKRTVSEATDSPATFASDSKSSPFGAARPIDTATREKEIEEKRLQAIREKREAEEKAKEERQLARQAAAAKADAEAQAEDQKASGVEVKEKVVESKEDGKREEGAVDKVEGAETRNGAVAEHKLPVRGREGREPRDSKAQMPSANSRSAEAGNWRSDSNEHRMSRGQGGRGGRGGGAATRGARNDGRGPRANGSHAQQVGVSPTAEAEAPELAAEEAGWTRVPNKKGRQGRTVAS